MNAITLFTMANAFSPLSNIGVSVIPIYENSSKQESVLNQALPKSVEDSKWQEELESETAISRF